MAGQNPLDTPLYAVGSRFETVAKHVLGIEGGLSDLASDHGGTTKYGISLRFLIAEGRLNPQIAHDLDLDMDGDLDGADIRLLSRQEALNLYFTCFWRRLDLDRLPAPIDGAVFDQAVNGGTFAAVKMLQKAINRCDIKMSVMVDGVLGRVTCAAAGICVRSLPGDLIDKYRQEAELRYNAIVRADHSKVEFLDGWVRRARRLGDV